MNSHKIEHERKLNAIIDRMDDGGYMVYVTDRAHPNETRHRIERQTLKLLIIEALGITDRHCVSTWINCLISLKIIEPNPTSQEWNRNGIIMPHDSTCYYINKDKLIRHTLSCSMVSTTKRQSEPTSSL